MARALQMSLGFAELNQEKPHVFPDAGILTKHPAPPPALSCRIQLKHAGWGEETHGETELKQHLHAAGPVQGCRALCRAASASRPAPLAACVLPHPSSVSRSQASSLAKALKCTQSRN